MIYISYFTQHTPYEEVIETHLHPTLHKWKLNHDIESIIDKGNWQKNTHYKAEFIKKMLLKHKQPVIFLDADAKILENPVLFEKLNDYDVGLHYSDWRLLWRKEKGQDKREALSGTLYLNYNEKALKFLDEWIEKNNNNIQWEQRNMEILLEEWKNKIKVYKLPPEYCVIIMRDGSIPEWYITEKPVILHHQVSRKYKK